MTQETNFTGPYKWLYIWPFMDEQAKPKLSFARYKTLDDVLERVKDSFGMTIKDFHEIAAQLENLVHTEAVRLPNGGKVFRVDGLEANNDKTVLQGVMEAHWWGNGGQWSVQLFNEDKEEFEDLNTAIVRALQMPRPYNPPFPQKHCRVTIIIEDVQEGEPTSEVDWVIEKFERVRREQK